MKLDSQSFQNGQPIAAEFAAGDANGFAGNTWRIQMIKMAKAYAATPDMKPHLKEFKIV